MVEGDGSLRRGEGGDVPPVVAQLREGVQAGRRRIPRAQAGIPPTPQHKLEIVNLMRDQKVPLILMEVYFDEKDPNFIASKTGAKVLILPPPSGESRRRRTTSRSSTTTWTSS